ncbi:MAG: peptidoglycan editing factor PgeF [Chloroflexi bacterium]|nr:peptidoglycan editing factor PgeF [Chloroflexota bacterium]
MEPTPVQPTPDSPAPAHPGYVPLTAFTSFDRPWLAHGVSTRAGGVSTGPYASLNLGASVGDDEQAVMENRARLARTAGFAPERMVTTPQVHGCDVLVVDEETAPVALSVRADILVTRERGFLLMQRFADCVPILLADTHGRAVSVAHAGWRGTALDVAARAVEAITELGAEPADLHAGIGPSIGPCCFEVGEEVVAAFPDADGARSTGPNGRPHLDLWEINRRQLVRAGVPPDQIEVLGICTRCTPDTYFSHRALGYPAGRFGAVIGLHADG